MPTELSPDVAAFLELLAEGPKLSFRDLPVEEARAAADQVGALFDAPADPTVGVEDAVCKTAERNIAVRCYTPRGADAAAPAIVFAHGGGWITGGIEGYDSFCRFLAARSGLRVVSVDYRRAPEAVHPAALDDVEAAARWVGGGGSPLGRVGGLVLAGDSAGGQLAAALGGGSAAAGLDVRALLLLYPVTDLSRRAPSYAQFAEGYLLTADDMDYFISSYAPDAATRLQPDCSPLLGVAAAPSLPPVVVLTCSHDVLRDEGRAYAEACRARGIEVRYIEAKGHVHGIAVLRKIAPSAVAWLEQAIDELLVVANPG